MIQGGIRGWWRRRQQRRQARVHLDQLFADPAQLSGTSLRPKHRGRVDILDFAIEGDSVVSVDFTILRHPRPYPFSRQYHKVIQRYRYNVAEATVRHIESVNVSRAEGRDGEPPGSGI